MYLLKNTYLILLAFFVALSGCSKDDEPRSSIPPDAVFDIVTLVESSKDGCVCEFQKNGDSPVITYTSKYDLASSSTHVDVGDRLIICYKRVNGQIYTSGQIVLYAFAKLANTEKEVTTSDSNADVASMLKPIKVISLWRTGQYINIDADLYVYKAQWPEKYELIADAATVDDAYPELYIVYSNKDGNDGLNPYNITASFDMHKIWDRPQCQGVVVKYATPDGIKSQTFSK